MISWKQAQALTPNAFAKVMLAELEAQGEGKPGYAELARLIYRSHSRMMTWLAPASREPLPLNERHHLWLAVQHRTDKPETVTAPPELRQSWDWTEKEDDFLARHYQHMTHQQLADGLQRTRSSVSTRLHKLGLIKRDKITGWTEQEDAYLRQHYRHMTHEDMGRALGRTYHAVQRRCVFLGLIKSMGSKRRFTEQEMILVRDTSISASEVAERLKRSPNSITNQRKKLGLTKTYKKRR